MTVNSLRQHTGWHVKKNTRNQGFEQWLGQKRMRTLVEPQTRVRFPDEAHIQKDDLFIAIELFSSLGVTIKLTRDAGISVVILG